MRGQFEEIDGTELGGNDEIVMSMHAEDNPNYWSGVYTFALPGQTFGGTWVTYAVKWEPNKVIWYVNNKPVRITRDIDFRRWYDPNEHKFVFMQARVPYRRMGLILNNWFSIDQNRYNMEQPAVFPNTYDIDYVRVYQRFVDTLSINSIPANPVFYINDTVCGEGLNPAHTPITIPCSGNLIMNAEQS